MGVLAGRMLIRSFKADPPIGPSDDGLAVGTKMGSRGRAASSQGLVWIPERRLGEGVFLDAVLAGVGSGRKHDGIGRIGDLIEPKGGFFAASAVDPSEVGCIVTIATGS